MDKPSAQIEELEALFKLLEKGAITKDEYDMQKKAILASHQDDAEANCTEEIIAQEPDRQDQQQPSFTPSQPQQHSASLEPNPSTSSAAQSAVPPKKQNNSVKIILILVIGLIILVAMYFIFRSKEEPKTAPVAVAASNTNMASNIQPASAPQVASETGSETASEAKQTNQQEEISEDATGLSLNTRTPEELNNLLIKYQQQRSRAEARLRKVWAGLDEDFKNSILDEQKIWDNTALEENCTLEGYKSPEALQVAKLYCESGIINSRAETLLERQKEDLAQIKEEMVDQAEQKSKDAIQRLEITWKTIPQDVQQNLNQTYLQWIEETTGYCLSRPTAKNVPQTKINMYQCISDKAEKKIQELNGYKI